MRSFFVIPLMTAALFSPVVNTIPNVEENVAALFNSSEQKQSISYQMVQGQNKTSHQCHLAEIRS